MGLCVAWLWFGSARVLLRIRDHGSSGGAHVSSTEIMGYQCRSGGEIRGELVGDRRRSHGDRTCTSSEEPDGSAGVRRGGGALGRLGGGANLHECARHGAISAGAVQERGGGAFRRRRATLRLECHGRPWEVVEGQCEVVGGQCEVVGGQCEVVEGRGRACALPRGGWAPMPPPPSAASTAPPRRRPRRRPCCCCRRRRRCRRCCRRCHCHRHRPVRRSAEGPHRRRRRGAVPGTLAAPAATGGGRRGGRGGRRRWPGGGWRRRRRRRRSRRARAAHQRLCAPAHAKRSARRKRSAVRKRATEGAVEGAVWAR